MKLKHGVSNHCHASAGSGDPPASLWIVLSIFLHESTSLEGEGLVDRVGGRVEKENDEWESEGDDLVSKAESPGTFKSKRKAAISTYGELGWSLRGDPAQLCSNFMSLWVARLQQEEENFFRFWGHQNLLAASWSLRINTFYIEEIRQSVADFQSPIAVL